MKNINLTIPSNETLEIVGNSGGGKFQPNAVLHISENPYYKAYVTHKGQVYPGQHKAIIQEIFKKHGREGQKRENMMLPSFLKGIIRCESCDTSMIPTYCVKNGMRYRYYVCQKHHKFKSCNSAFKTVPADPVEEQVVNEIIRILKSPEILVHIDKLAISNKDINRDALLKAVQNLKEIWNYLY